MFNTEKKIVCDDYTCKHEQIFSILNMLLIFCYITIFHVSCSYMNKDFDLILYVPSTIFQLNRDGSSWVEPVLSKDKCVLLKNHNAVTPVRLEPAALRSRVKHFTTEPMWSLHV